MEKANVFVHKKIITHKIDMVCVSFFPFKKMMQEGIHIIELYEMEI